MTGISFIRKYCFVLIFVVHIMRNECSSQGAVFLGHCGHGELLCLALPGNSDHMFYSESLRAQRVNKALFLVLGFLFKDGLFLGEQIITSSSLQSLELAPGSVYRFSVP